MPDWKYYLAKSPAPGADPTLPLERVGWLKQATGRTLAVAMGRAGECGFNYDIFNPYSSFLFSGVNYCIECERDKEYVWSGPLANNAGSSDTNKKGSMQIKAVGWLELLTKRELREDVTYGATNPATSAPWTDWEIVQDLLNRVINYDVAHAPPIRWGGHFGDPINRQASWKKGVKVEQCFRELMEVEAGVHIAVDPSDRLLYVYAWDYYTDRTNLTFGYNKPPNNIAKLSWRVDFLSNLLNRYSGYGQNNTAALAEDGGSQDIYGLMEDTVNLPGNLTQNALLGYVGAEVTLKAKPMLFYDFEPAAVAGIKTPERRSVPMLFKDFDIGDVCRLSLDYGPLQEDERKIRMFGVTLAIGDDSSERMTNVQTTASAA
jgi:hypothetical protein